MPKLIRTFLAMNAHELTRMNQHTAVSNQHFARSAFGLKRYSVVGMVRENLFGHECINTNQNQTRMTSGLGGEVIIDPQVGGA